MVWGGWGEWIKERNGKKIITLKFKLEQIVAVGYLKDKHQTLQVQLNCNKAMSHWAEVFVFWDESERSKKSQSKSQYWEKQGELKWLNKDKQLGTLSKKKKQ